MKKISKNDFLDCKASCVLKPLADEEKCLSLIADKLKSTKFAKDDFVERIEKKIGCSADYSFHPIYEYFVQYAYKTSDKTYDHTTSGDVSITTEYTNTYAHSSQARGVATWPIREANNKNNAGYFTSQFNRYDFEKNIPSKFKNRDGLIENVMTMNVDDMSAYAYLAGTPPFTKENHNYFMRKIAKEDLSNSKYYDFKVLGYQIFAYLEPIFHLIFDYDGKKYHFYVNMFTGEVIESGIDDNGILNYVKDEAKVAHYKKCTKHNRTINYLFKLPLLLLPALALLIAIGRKLNNPAVIIFIVLLFVPCLIGFIKIHYDYLYSHEKKSLKRFFLDNKVAFIFNVLLLLLAAFIVFFAVAVR